MKFDFFSTFILLFLAVLGFSQTEDRVETEIYCESINYQFKVEGNLYNPGKRSRVYVCPKNLPVEVLVRKIDNTPIIGDIKWEINGTASSFVGNPILLNQSEFDGEKIELKCSFTDNGLQELKIIILKNLVLNFSEKKKKFQFDDNRIQAYRDAYYPSTPPAPWNFIGSGDLDVLTAKVSKKKGYYAVNKIESELNIYPTSLLQAKSNITLNYVGSGHQVLSVQGCGDVPELLIYTGDIKVFSVDVLEVCDSDDDIQVVEPGTIVVSDKTVCLDSGIDGTFDEFRTMEILGNNKLAISPSGGQIIVAGEAESSGDYVCRTKAKENKPPKCPAFEYDYVKGIQFANTLFNRIGIYVELGKYEKKILNYDIVKENGPLDRKEQFEIHFRLYNSAMANTQVYVVPDLGFSDGEKVLGRATNLGLNSLALDVSDVRTATLAHEIGHARWSLKHPSTQFGIWDEKNFMFFKNDDDLQGISRRYQWKIMRNE